MHGDATSLFAFSPRRMPGGFPTSKDNKKYAVLPADGTIDCLGNFQC